MTLEREDREEIRHEILKQLRSVVLNAWSEANEANDQTAKNIIRMYFLPAVDKMAQPYDEEALRKLEEKLMNE